MNTQISDTEPKTLEEFIGNRTSVEQVLREIHLGLNNRIKPILIHGPSGVGKTVLAKLIAEKYGLIAYEINPMTVGTKEDLEKRLKGIGNSNTLFGSKFLVVFDDVESLLGTERGISSVISGYLSSPGQIVMVTANELYNKRMAAIRNHCTVVEFKKISSREIKKRLGELNSKLSLGLEEVAIEQIAEQAEGDLRAAVNDLLARNITSYRDLKKNIFEALRVIFKGKDTQAIRTTVLNLDVDLDMLRHWLVENIAREYERFDEIDIAFDYISKSDIMSRRIMKRQNWKLLRYASDLAVLGTAFAKHMRYSKFTPYKYPSTIRALSKTMQSSRMKNQVGLKLGAKTHTGWKDSVGQIDIEKTIALAGPVDYAGYYGLDGDELAFVLGIEPKKAAKILAGDEPRKKAAKTPRTKAAKAAKEPKPAEEQKDDGKIERENPKLKTESEKPKEEPKAIGHKTRTTKRQTGLNFEI